MKKLKQIAATLVSVILAGTVTVNASAAESMETPYRSPTLSSFPSNASLEDLEKASDNEDLRIISSPSRGANYKTRAAEAVALLRIYSTTGSGSSSSFTNLGHSWLMITNLSGSTVNIAGINVADGNDMDQLRAAFEEAKTVKGQPTAIIAKTVKGKGVSFMENQASWHGTAPNDEQYAVAMADLEKVGEALCQK